MLILILFLLYLALIGLSFYFSGSEAGFVSFNEERYRHDLTKPWQKARLNLLKPLLGKMEVVLGVTLVGNNLVNIAATLIGEQLWIRATQQASLWVFTLLSTFIFLIFCEVFPKIIFKKYANELLYSLGGSIHFFKRAFSPLVWFIVRASSVFVNPFLVSKRASKQISKADLNLIVDDVVEDGLMDAEDKAFWRSLSSLSSTKVSEIMVPLVDLFFVGKNQNIKAISKGISKERRDLIPVYEGRIDNIVGIIDCVDVFNAGKRKKTSNDLMQEVAYFPETNTLDQLYRLFSKQPIHSVVAVDEYGGCTGIVHEKDIVGYIFGFQKQRDHGRHSRERRRTRKVNPKIYEVDALCGLGTLNEELGWSLSNSNYQTLSGYLNHLFGRVPREGEVRKTKHYTFRILKASHTCAERVSIELRN